MATRLEVHVVRAVAGVLVVMTWLALGCHPPREAPATPASESAPAIGAASQDDRDVLDVEDVQSISMLDIDQTAEHVLIAHADGRVTEVDLAGREEVEVRPAGPLTYAAYAPDGDLAWFNLGDRVQSWSRSRGVLGEPSEPLVEPVLVSPAPQGRVFATTGDQRIVTLDEHGWQELGTLPQPAVSLAAFPKAVPGGEPFALYVTQDGASGVVSLSQPPLETFPPGYAAGGISISPDGTTVAISRTSGGGIQLVPLIGQAPAFETHRFIPWTDGKLGPMLSAAWLNTNTIVAQRYVTDVGRIHATMDASSLRMSTVVAHMRGRTGDVAVESLPAGTIGAAANGVVVWHDGSTLWLDAEGDRDVEPAVVVQGGHATAAAQVRAVLAGTRVVSRGDAGDVLVTDVATGAVLRRMEGPFMDIVASPDGQSFLLSSPRGVEVWRADTLHRLTTVEPGQFVYATYAERGQAVRYRTEAGSVYVSAASGAAMRFPWFPEVESIRERDGVEVVRDYKTGIVSVRPASTDAMAERLPGAAMLELDEGELLRAVTFERGGEHVLVVTSQGGVARCTVFALDAKRDGVTPRKVGSWTSDAVLDLTGNVAFTDGIIAWASEQHIERRTAKGRKIDPIDPDFVFGSGNDTSTAAGDALWPGARDVTAVRDGLVVSADIDGRLSLWDPKAKRRLWVASAAARYVPRAHAAHQGRLAVAYADHLRVWSPTGKAVFESYVNDGRRRGALANAPSLAVLVREDGSWIGRGTRWKSAELVGADGRVRAVATAGQETLHGGLLSPDGSAVLLWGANALFRWPLPDADEAEIALTPVEVWDRTLTPVAVSNAARRVATFAFRGDLRDRSAEVVVFDVVANAALCRWDFEGGGRGGVALSRDGKTLYLANGDVVRVDVEGCRELDRKPAMSNQVALSVDEHSLVTANRVSSSVLVRDATSLDVQRSVDLGFTPMFIAPGPEGSVWAIGPSGEIEWARAGTEPPRFRLFGEGVSGFGVVRDDGVYWASEDFERTLGFVRDGARLPAEEVSLTHHRPADVSTSMRSGRRGPTPKWTDATDAPRVHGPLWSDEGSVELTIAPSAKGTKPPARLFVRVDGTPFPNREGLGWPSGADTQTVRIALRSGVNQVDVVLEAEDGTRTGVGEHRVVATKRARPSAYVLAIGVSDYGDASVDLPLAVVDAQSVAEAIERTGAGFERVRTKLLLDRGASRSAVLEEGRRFVESAGVEDDVFVYVAGHGAVDDAGEYRFVSSGVDPRGDVAGGVSFAEFDALFDGLDARRRTLILDTCFSGGNDVDRVAIGKPTESAGTYRHRGVRRAKRPVVRAGAEALDVGSTRVRTGSGAMVLAAAAGAEFAYEGSGAVNGVFATALLETFRTRRADANADGDVSLVEILDHVSRDVARVTGGRQNPTLRRPTAAITGAFISQAHRAASGQLSTPSRNLDVWHVVEPPGYGEVALSPDGCEVAAFAENMWRRWSVDRGEGVAEQRAASEKRCTALFYAGPGTVVCTVSDGGVYVWPRSKRRATRLAVDTSALPTAVQDGADVFVQTKRGVAQISTEGPTVVSEQAGASLPAGPRFGGSPFADEHTQSSNGGARTIWTRDGRVGVRDAEGRPLWERPTKRLIGLAISADGKTVAVETLDEVLVLEAETGDPVSSHYAPSRDQRIEQELFDASRLQLSADGTRLLADRFFVLDIDSKARRRCAAER